MSEAAAADCIPEQVLAILRAEPGPEAEFDQAIPLLTVDKDSFPHVALLSRGQLRAGPGGRDSARRGQRGRDRRQPAGDPAGHGTAR